MATTALRVAVWAVPTMVSDSSAPHEELGQNMVSHLNASERMRLLEERVEAASQRFAQFATPPGAATLDVFVAPEYLFANSARTHFLPEDTKNLLVKRLKALSARHPGFVIIPGTIAWKKPIERKASFANFFRTSRVDKANARLVAAGGFIPQQKKFMDKSIARLPQAEFLGGNTAYVMHRGKVLLKYHKRGDGGEVNAQDRVDGEVVWVPGVREGTFATPGGVRFGLEICAETSDMLKRTQVSGLDVYVLIAASNSLRSGVVADGVVRDGGFMLHADGGGNKLPVVRQRVGTTAQDVRPVAAIGTPTFSPSGAMARAQQLRDARTKVGQAVSTDPVVVEATALGGKVGYYDLLLA